MMAHPIPLWGEDEAFVDPPTWGKLPFRGVPGGRDVNAWMWDHGPMLNLGQPFGGKMKRIRLKAAKEVEQVRWRLLCHMKGRVRPAWEAALEAIRDSPSHDALYAPTDDHARFARMDSEEILLISYIPGSVYPGSVRYGWPSRDRPAHPLIQLARIPHNDARFKLGEEWVRVEKWRCDCMLKLLKVDTMLMTIFWYLQSCEGKQGDQITFTLNGRHYPSDNYLREVFPSAWPTPDREEIVL